VGPRFSSTANNRSSSWVELTAKIAAVAPFPGESLLYLYRTVATLANTLPNWRWAGHAGSGRWSKLRRGRA
jgi:hypothetical protein